MLKKRKKKKSGSLALTLCLTAIRALGQICVIMHDGKVIYTGGLGWIGKFGRPALHSPYLWPCPSSLRLNWSQREEREHLREAVSKSSKKPGEDQSGVMLMVIERSWWAAAVVTCWKTPPRLVCATQIKPELSHEQVVYVIQHVVWNCTQN